MTRNKIWEIRKKLIEQVKRIKVPLCISIALVGSFQYNKKLKKVNDADFIIIVQSLTLQVYNTIIKEFRKIARNLENDNIKVIISTKAGPYNPYPINGKEILQLHLLIKELRLWKNHTARSFPAFVLDCNNFNILLQGKKLKNIYSIKKLNKKQIIDELKYNIKNIMKKQAYLLAYKIKKGKIETIKKVRKVSGKKYLKVIIYSVIVSWMNYLRCHNPLQKKDYGIMLKKAKKLLPLNHYNFLQYLFSIKELIYNNKEINGKVIKNLRTGAISFIELLINKLK